MGRIRLWTAVAAALVMTFTMTGGTPSASATGTPVVSLTGTVMGFSNDPDNGWDDPVPGAIVAAVAPTTGRVLATTITDAEGHFAFGKLPARPVKVRVRAPGWLTTWAPAERIRAEGAVFRVTRDGTTDIGTVSLFKPAAIAGQVLSRMDPVAPYSTVTVFDAHTHARLGWTTTDEVGNYQVDGLWPTQVKVRASHPGFITNWADSFGQQTWSTATVFTLQPGVVLRQTWSPSATLYLDIMPEAVIEGQVLGNGAPLRKARVTVFDATTGAALRTTLSDRSGNYRIDQIATWGQRTVKVRATRPGWRTSWANWKWTKGTADTFTLYPGAYLQSSGQDVLYLNLARPWR